MENTEAIDLKQLLRANDPAFIPALLSESRTANKFSAVLGLNNLRKKALQTGLLVGKGEPLRLALVGGATLHPLVTLVEHFVSVFTGSPVETWVGDYDNYLSEIMDRDSELHAFGPNIVFIMPSEQRCRYTGPLNDPSSLVQAHVDAMADEIFGLAQQAREGTGAEVIVTNFRLTASFDPGRIRHSSLASDYSFRRAVNTRLGFEAPSWLRICDVEFLANRIGTLAASDNRSWYESKQPYSADLTLQVAKEIGYIVESMKTPPKKVIVLDLDNTLWGGIIGDDGLEGIEIGTTSPRGEAFRHFQQTLLDLSKRGVLLAVCSKNDHEKAVEPFLKHPEMVLKLDNIVNFKANWEPKSENIRQIATELSLGLDSFVFVDDNPAEIEIVNQFLPQVTTLWIGDDPATFVDQLVDSRLFEIATITQEDAARVEQYRQEAQRQVLQSTATDMGTYLESLGMVGEVSPFNPIDAPRITQLVNKSNQFNLTTRRRTESEIESVMIDPEKVGFTVRLEDKFGAHGLIAIVIGQAEGENFVIDTWLMSCRVLKRQVEEFTLNEIVRVAKERGCTTVIGEYIPTSKNQMVRDLYPNLGFEPIEATGERSKFALNCSSFVPFETKIRELVNAYAGKSNLL